MNLEQLRRKINSEELLKSRADMGDDQGIADSLNAKTVDALKPVPAAEVLIWVAEHDVMTSLEAMSKLGDKRRRGVAKAALALISSPHVTELDLRIPAIRQMLEAISSGPQSIDDEAKAALIELAATKISVAEDQLGRDVTVHEVSQSLKSDRPNGIVAAARQT